MNATVATSEKDAAQLSTDEASRVVIDGTLPWPSGVPTADTVRGLLLNRAKAVGLTPAAQEKFERSFHQAPGANADELAKLRDIVILRWRYAAAVALGPAGGDWSRRRFQLDETSAATLLKEGEATDRVLTALTDAAKNRPELAAIRERFTQDLAEYRDMLSRARDAAANAKDEEPTPLPAPEATRKKTPQTPIPTAPEKKKSAPAFVPLDGERKSRKLLWTAVFSFALSGALLMWSPEKPAGSGIALPEGVPPERVILSKEGTGLVYSPDGSPISDADAKNYAEAFARQGITMTPGAPGQYVLNLSKGK